jgi:hypothetical protein
MSFRKLIPLFEKYAYLQRSTIARFEDLVGHVKPSLVWAQPAALHAHSAPPHTLPDALLAFLREALKIHDTRCIQDIWSTLKDEIWEAEQPDVGDRELKLFLEHGYSNGIGTQASRAASALT